MRFTKYLFPLKHNTQLLREDSGTPRRERNKNRIQYRGNVVRQASLGENELKQRKTVSNTFLRTGKVCNSISLMKRILPNYSMTQKTYNAGLKSQLVTTRTPHQGILAK